MASACSTPEPLSCEDKADIELINAQREFEKLCNAAGVNELIQLFIAPLWASNGDDQRKALVHYLTRQAICRPGNNLGTDCDPELPCEDPQPTYCDDPEECESKFYGIGLLELIREYLRTSGMVVIPVKDLDLIAAGEPLVWDPGAAPDNQTCDPCVDPELGAFVPQHIYEAENP